MATIPIPTFMDAREAGRILERSLKQPNRPLTLADAATQSGLALRDAERGLHWLASDYRGQLRVTSEGELLFVFPTGFTKPWKTRDAMARALDAVWRGTVMAGRFIVRAWLMIALIAYAAIFVAVFVGLTLARQGDGGRRGRGGLPGSEVAYVLLRVLADALFWTFHPFSPFAYRRGDSWGESWGGRREARPRDETPFYEKVNRFFFGPTAPPVDPRDDERRLLALIRAKSGRIGLGDVMRVTGLPREQADPMMARLMLDYEGDVDVSEDGGITYRFEALRKTALDDAPGTPESPPAPAWARARALLPLTGNSVGANVGIAALNLFNLVMSLVALDNGLTLEKLRLLFARVPLEAIPDTGTAIALGVVPLVMSLALFALPIARAALRPIKARAVAHENGRLAVVREVVGHVEKKEPITDAALVEAWTKAAGHAPASMELTREVTALGGDVEIQESGEVRYRFVDLETEGEALEAERGAAPDEEKAVGKVIFASDD